MIWADIDEVCTLWVLSSISYRRIWQSMFSYAVKHHTKKADIEARNRQNLSPLTLASKLGRFQLFNEIIQLQSYVSFPFRCCLLISSVVRSFK